MNQQEGNLPGSEPNFLDYLGKYITPHKKAAIERVLSQRTRFFTVVLEDIFKPHNASAVLRTCDCFGIQNIHLIEKTDTYKVNPFVTRGAAQWVDLHKYFTPEGSAVDQCFGRLRSEGYAIFGTSPATNSLSIHELAMKPNQKVALVFGNEHEGISEEVKSKVDGLVHIPMRGFTESFNISVSVSIFLYELMKRAKEMEIPDFLLSDEECDELRLRWYKDIVPHAEIHERHFWQQNQNL
ncbi:MAG: RNA methyltransferase [Algoriphagus sp.]|nr:RNA methyltransferase [Algoriphagus sp.]